MKTTQLIREELGISQLTMAQYLSIPLSQLAMYETGKRDLPSKASVKIAEMLLFLNGQQKTVKTENIIEETKVKEFIAHVTKELEYKQIKEQRKLDAILKKYKQSIQLHSLANYLHKSDSLQASVLLQQAKTGMEKYGLTMQTKQELKLKSIKSQLAYIKALKEE
jgi:transcriptional regulator with XRE-family HTH domain